jgi:ATP/maltotriose-dependent transcriptional regulator MalT
VHPHESLYVMTDLVTAASRTGREEEASLVAARLGELSRGGSPRLRQRAGHAAALVAGVAAGDAFRAVLADPDGARWPFERARVQLDLGRWLRRERRITEPRPYLTDAHDTFHRIGATPWEQLAATELRALGVRGAVDVGVLADLTPQQQEIVRLAAGGLSNKEIAERLMLSPRISIARSPCSGSPRGAS